MKMEINIDEPLLVIFILLSVLFISAITVLINIAISRVKKQDKWEDNTTLSLIVFLGTLISLVLLIIFVYIMVKILTPQYKRDIVQETKVIVVPFHQQSNLTSTIGSNLHVPTSKYKKNWLPPKPDPFTLKITTKTGVTNHARVDVSDIYVSIDNLTKYRKKLDDGGKNNFQKGMTDSFDCEFDYPLSKVTNIVINIKGIDAWYCEGVILQFIQSNMYSDSIQVKVNRWFSTEKRDKGGISSLQIPVKGKVRLRKTIQ